LYNKLEEQKKLDVPGPGKYEMNTTLVQASLPSWKIGNSSRENKEIEGDKKKIVPGPGTYHSENVNNLINYGKVGIK